MMLLGRVLDTLVFTATGDHPAPLIMPPIAFAGVAAAIFLTLALITWSFRDVANRHSDKVSDSQDMHH
jgi:hypothetical protein